MSSSSTSEAITDSIFVCDCEWWMRSACAGEPLYQEYNGKRYCVLHFPEDKDVAVFDETLRRKLDAEDFNFQGVHFPSKLHFDNFTFRTRADFRSAEFADKVDFQSAEFLAEAYFFSSTFNEDADFRGAKFKAEAHFSHSTFNAKVDFSDAKFFEGAEAKFFFSTFNAEARFQSAEFWNLAHFSNTTFNAEVTFRSAKFNAQDYFFLATFNSGVSFHLATFNGNASFSDVTFRDFARFQGSVNTQTFNLSKAPDFQYARVEKPGHISFDTLVLHPSWFINVDGHEFDFTNVDWDWDNFSQEIKDVKNDNRLRLLSIACRRLATNAEENHRYEEASKFRYWSMDVQRIGRRHGFEKFRSLGWWYWVVSGYGERILNALGVLIAIWLLFTVLYMWVGFTRWEPRRTNERDAVTEPRDEVGEQLSFPHALTYSLGVMMLQRPEPRPATTAAQSFVILETILVHCNRRHLIKAFSCPTLSAWQEKQNPLNSQLTNYAL